MKKILIGEELSNFVTDAELSQEIENGNLTKIVLYINEEEKYVASDYYNAVDEVSRHEEDYDSVMEFLGEVNA